MRGVVTPTHFLNSRGVLLGINFLNTELIKPHFLRDEMLFMYCSLQIEQNIYSRGFFRAPVETQLMIKE